MTMIDILNKMEDLIAPSGKLRVVGIDHSERPFEGAAVLGDVADIYEAKEMANKRKAEFDMILAYDDTGSAAVLKSTKQKYGTLPSIQKEAVTSTTPGTYSPRYQMRKRSMEDLIHKTMFETAKECKVTMDILKKDDTSDFIKFLMETVYSGKFEGQGKSISEMIKEYIVRSLVKKKSVAQMVPKIKSMGGADMTPQQAEVIARTESQAVHNKMREYSYKKIDPEGKFKYKWINPLDDRTTDICRHLVSRTTGGVTLDTLKNLVEDESKKAGFEPREFTPHINCRSTFVRLI